MDSMEKLVSLCKRRGFIFPSSEIYGGLNGAWDYGPLGVELKRNLKQAWWDDMVAHHDETAQSGRSAVAVRHGRARQLDADEPEGLGGERPRRRFQRSDGRRPRDARALSRRPARGVCARVRRQRRQAANATTTCCSPRPGKSASPSPPSCSSRIASESRRYRNSKGGKEPRPVRGTGRAAGRDACAPRCSRPAHRHRAR